MPLQSIPLPRRYGPVNWLGLWTLYVREVRRFWKVGTQTIAAPVVSALLLLAVFLLALGGASQRFGDVDFLEFLAPGLIMMTMVQNAFVNTSSSLMISKVQGNIVDTVMPPLSPGEQTFGFALGGVTRGLVVGLAVALAVLPFTSLHVHDWAFVFFHAIAASLMLSLIGIIGGIWSEKFDQLAALTNFVVTPLSFLSGTFYSVSRLPEGWQIAAHLDPFFYMIDGFRYGFVGHADGSLSAGIWVLIVCNIGLWWLTHRMFASGYKLKT